MITPEKLSTAQRETAIHELTAHGWQIVEGRDAITKRYVFADFNEAFGWMTRVAMIAEHMNHHPEWSNVYKTVDVTLSTHDVAGLSALDVALATKMDRLAG
ncbi:4a-hydroxytetrahydrobiopterin dehydratase [Rhodophyticola sp. CCM32]|uniref:4a-hydroxytetrahydrobiopterin dehydratase n=1 Tax=Rhodophyticola sp. CCM32 TaxID=2916397 RepID=UPI00107FA171|nr:4a-hydroxytetrahydrobiopterin dehydratase [Rhodophyticola sp. CCM32]QBY02148.1 4a-hydroxytetrahydrobiopterin dehydratase [Rhodophyticola sp. CCM32]